VLAWFVITALGPEIVPVPSPALLAIALATVPVSVTTVHLTTVTLLLGRVSVVNRSLVVSAVAQCAALIGLGLADRLSVSTVVWTWVGSTLVTLFMLLPALRPHLGRVDARLVGRMITAGAQYHVGVAALFLLLRVDVLMLNALTTVTAVGLYSLAVSVGEMTYAGTDALALVLVRRQAEAQISEATDLTIRTTRLAFLTSVGSVSAACVAAPFLIPALYGDAFRGSVVALFALAPGLAAFSVTRVLGPYLLRLGRPRLMSGLSLAALTGNVVLNLALVPRWGIVGCGVATSAGYLVLAAGQLTWFCRSAGVSPRVLLPGLSDVAIVVAALRQTVSAGRPTRGKA